MKTIIIICGPTASGKTKFAHLLAKKFHGEVINCDSMQIYKQIPIISASPSASLMSELPYHLYNFWDLDAEFSVMKYIERAVPKLSQISLPIIVGGTGLYVSSLLYGYHRIPDILPEVRAETRSLYQKIGQVEFSKMLAKIDQSTSSSNLNQNDNHRMQRAYEVFLQTGKSITSFFKEKKVNPLENFSCKVIFLYPARSFLYKVCDERLIQIFKNGAIEEVKNTVLSLKNTNPMFDFSNLKALGFKEILNYIEGKITIDQALESAQLRTRHYAKRQITWFNNQIKDKMILKYSNIEEYEKLVIDNLDQQHIL